MVDMVSLFNAVTMQGVFQISKGAYGKSYNINGMHGSGQGCAVSSRRLEEVLTAVVNGARLTQHCALRSRHCTVHRVWGPG